MHTICKQFRFEAAHQLLNHDGQCARPHGHSYRVEVRVKGVPQVSGPKEGMVIDFSDLKTIWTTFCEPLLDHQDLNVTLASEVPVTTAENLAAWIHGEFKKQLPPGVMLDGVRVWETATGWAEYTP